MSRAILMAALALTAASPLEASSPLAEVICQSSKDLTRKLEQHFRAEKRGMGLRGAEQVMELWSDPEGDWVLVARYAQGTSCILAMGEAWQALSPESLPDGPA